MEYGLDEHTLHTMLRIFEQYPEIDEAILYGSRTKGNFKPFSDVDITLKGVIRQETLFAVNRALSESSLPYLFDISIFSTLNNQALIEHIDRCGKTLYRQSSSHTLS